MPITFLNGAVEHIERLAKILCVLSLMNVNIYYDILASQIYIWYIYCNDNQ